MPTIVRLYAPNYTPIYEDAYSLQIQGSVITFYTRQQQSGQATKIQASVPFIVEQGVAG